MVKNGLIRLMGVFIAVMALSAAHADAETEVESPSKWQFGLGIGSQTLADYRGSSYYQTKVLPIPFVQYRGDIIKIDREGMRGEFWASDRVEFNLSVDAALNGDGDDNPLRRGMPTLDSALELGPSVNIRLSGEDFSSGWSLRLPLRGVITLGSDGIDQQGYVVNPRLTWRSSVAQGQWQPGVTLGSIWASDAYHAYYYGVDEQYVTPERPGYAAEAGYSGSFVRVGLRKRWGNYWFATYLRYDHLAGAAFKDSPLVEELSSASLGIAWVRLIDFK
jgi:MipA family protein